MKIATKAQRSTKRFIIKKTLAPWCLGGRLGLIMDNRFFEQPILNSPYHYPKFHWELDKNHQPTQRIKEKKSTMETYWVPGVNNNGGYGRWAFVKLTDVYEIESGFNELVEELAKAFLGGAGGRFSRKEPPLPPNSAALNLNS
ncbi:MAG: type restriction enzyme [Acidobacteriota bacterium]|nr:type restriction enzyme [Acidobacteriota bacterium]